MHTTENAESQTTTRHVAEQAAGYQIPLEAATSRRGPIPHLSTRIALAFANAALAAGLLYVVLTLPVASHPATSPSHPAATSTQPLQFVTTPLDAPAFDNTDATAAAGLITPTPTPRRSSSGAPRATATSTSQSSQPAPPQATAPTATPTETRPTAVPTPTGTFNPFGA